MKTTDDQNELFPVVDKNDNVIDYRTRGECHSDKSLTHRSTSIVIFNDKNEILLQKRSMTKDMWPGYFTVSAAGHVTKGFSYEETAVREMEEEIGIKTPLTYRDKFYIEIPRESEFIAVYTGTHNGPFKINKTELDYAKFYSVEEVRRMKDKLTTAALKTLQVLDIID